MKKTSVYLWALVAFSFICLIGLMSYWYPVTLDEYYRWNVPFQMKMLTSSYISITPRISMFFTIPIYSLGKWFFILVNSLVQFVNALCIFYILFVRLPNIKDIKDMPYFIMILCMIVFFVCRPSEVMFWLSGAINYSWTILSLLLMLCFLRQIQAKKILFQDNWLSVILLFILGFIIGMSNECLSPIALGLTIIFALGCNFKQIRTPKGLSSLIFGIAIGCLVFFSAPAHYNKMGLEGLINISAASLWDKLFFHIYHINEFFQAQFYIFPLTALFLIIACLDKDNRDFKQKDLWLSLIMIIISFSMAFILFMVPKAPVRAYYPASVSCLISFLFLVRYYVYAYKFDFSKWLCYLIVIISLILAPRFILPHYFLHIQEKERNLILERFPDSEVMPYTVLAGPTKNLTIGFGDPANRIRVDGKQYAVDFTIPTNW